MLSQGEIIMILWLNKLLSEMHAAMAAKKPPFLFIIPLSLGYALCPRYTPPVLLMDEQTRSGKYSHAWDKIL